MKHKVSDGFKHAVVYPLYRDADDAVSGSRFPPWSQVKSDPTQSEKSKNTAAALVEYCQWTYSNAITVWKYNSVASAESNSIS